MERGVYEEMLAVEQDHWWFRARREILASELSRLPIPTGRPVIEVGCGTGGNLEMLAGFGPLTGIEPDDEARRHASVRSGLTILPGALPSGLPDLEGRFGLVAALDVVEHVEDDRRSLKALCSLAMPGGYVLLTAPAYQWMWSAHDERHHHKRRYTAARLRDRLSEAKLIIRRLTYFNTLLFPPIAAVRLLQRLSVLPESDNEQMPSAPVNNLLRRIFLAERSLLQKTDLPFGVSLLAICERPL